MESAEFDTRDSLLSESELTQFPLLNGQAPGRGPNMISFKKHFLKDKEKLLHNRDLIHFFRYRVVKHGKRKNEQTLGGHDSPKKKN